MCLCGRTCVSAEAVSFHGSMQDKLELAGRAQQLSFVPSAFVVSARGMKALLALRKGLVNHLAHTQETVSIGPSTEKALFRVAFGDMYCSQLLALNQQKWRLNGKERLLESGKSRSWALIGGSPRSSSVPSGTTLSKEDESESLVRGDWGHVGPSADSAVTAVVSSSGVRALVRTGIIECKVPGACGEKKKRPPRLSMTGPGPVPSKVVPEGRESRCLLTALLPPHGSPGGRDSRFGYPAEASGFEGPTGGYGFAWFGNLSKDGIHL